MPRQIIGLCGPAKSGKSLAANYLSTCRGFTRIRFAGPLKAMLAALGLTTDEIEGRLKERPCALLGGRTPRHAMITLGTEWGRQMIHPDLWINAWNERLSRLPPGKSVVVEDCRFGNEAAAIRAYGGVLIRLHRAGAGITTGVAVGHESEALNFEPDIHMQNDGTPLELFDQLYYATTNPQDVHVDLARAA